MADKSIKPSTLFLLIGAVLLATIIFVYFARNIKNVGDVCGILMPAKITYNLSSAITCFPRRIVNMFAIVPDDGKTSIYLSLSPYLTDGYFISFGATDYQPVNLQTTDENVVTNYVSHDRGKTWQRIYGEAGKNLTGGLNAGFKYLMDPIAIMSHVSPDVLYRNSISDNGFQFSVDQGVSWTKVSYALFEGRRIDKLKIFDTGTHSAQCVYAILYDDETNEQHMAVSDDYGRHFKKYPPKFPWELTNIIRVRSSSSILYGDAFISLDKILEDKKKYINQVDKWT